MMILSLPWILVSFLFYNGIVLSASFGEAELTKQGIETILAQKLFGIPTLEATWEMTLGDLVLLTAMIALFVEILKATQTRSMAILDHGLSVVVFIICLVEFLTLKSAATSVFFFITLLSLIDVVAGFSVGIRAARRDFNIPSAG